MMKYKNILTMQTISKKVPVAMAIGWLTCVILLYLAMIVYVFSRPWQYAAFIEQMLSSQWQGSLLLTVVPCVTVLTLLPIYILAQKAGVIWLKIVSLVYLLTNATLFVMCGIQLLTRLA